MYICKANGRKLNGQLAGYNKFISSSQFNASSNFLKLRNQ